MPIAPAVVVIGAGFSGLATAWELVQHGIRPTIVECDNDVGGLAGTFPTGGDPLEKFYHHWFTSDIHAFNLAEELGLGARIMRRATATAAWYANAAYRLATPIDVLRFPHLRFADRLRLGKLALTARRGDLTELESLTAEEWLVSVGGRRVYDVIWKPLLEAKFGPYASRVSATWIAAKLRLRGGSRKRGGAEELAYFQGGFGGFARAIAQRIEAGGGTIATGETATSLAIENGIVVAVHTDRRLIQADAVVATPALPIIAELVQTSLPPVAASFRRIAYLANTCMVLELDRSLSQSYWLNICDPSYPFVAVIEHTNFQRSEQYAGSHVVYLSRYLAHDDPDYTDSPDLLGARWLRALSRMFPDFASSWLLRSHVWRTRYAQPIVTRGYRSLIPPHSGDCQGLYVASMAQIYPEDRGTNYAIRDGRAVARMVARDLSRTS